jgi:hypothetical protein
MSACLQNRAAPDPTMTVPMKPCFLASWLPPLLFGLALLSSTRADAESTNRGVWCWKSPSPYGLNYIIGTNDLENAAVAQFKLWGVSRVYGSYGDQLKTVQGQTALAAWNTLLNSNGIESQLLISDNTLTSGDSNNLVAMINFNKSQPAAARCQAVHLDLEPWGLSTWDTGSNYQMLVTLADTYQAVRAELNANGQSNVLIYADLADWLNSLTSVNWPSASVRDQWYSSLLQSLAGFTLMAYDQPTFSDIESVVSYAMTNDPGAVRVGLDAGAGETWSKLSDFITVASQVESTYSDTAGIDIYDFITVETVAPPVLSIGSVLPLTTNGFNLTLQAPIGSNYVIQASTDLINWQTITDFVSASWLTYFTDPAATHFPSRFYQTKP